MLAVGLFLCFTLAYAAELIGLAGIIGAFAAGLVLDPYGEGVRAREGDRALSELLHPFSTLIVPLFFVLMGIKVDLGVLASGPVFALAAALTACASAGKLVCGLGVVDRSVSRSDRRHRHAPARRGRADLRGHRHYPCHRRASGF